MEESSEEEGGGLKKIYNQRPQVETTNFMIKTHTGFHVLSRLDRTKVIQTLCKVMPITARLFPRGVGRGIRVHDFIEA